MTQHQNGTVVQGEVVQTRPSVPAMMAGASPAQIASAVGSKAVIEARYGVAQVAPRNEAQARIDILEAVRRPQMAERAEYKKPVGGGTVRGPSIRLAELALQKWGNIVTDTTVLHDDQEVRRLKITVTDLQTNSTFGREIAVQKVVERKTAPEDREVLGSRTNSLGKKVYLVRATDDELQVKESALVSKVLRNEGLRVIPSDIVDEALEVARQTMQKRDAVDPTAARKRLADGFAALGIKPVDLEKYLGHSLDSTSPPEMDDLRALYGAIRDGETTWMEVLKASQASPEASQAENGSAATQRVRSRIKGARKPQDAPPAQNSTPPEDHNPGQEQLTYPEKPVVSGSRATAAWPTSSTGFSLQPPPAEVDLQALEAKCIELAEVLGPEDLKEARERIRNADQVPGGAPVALKALKLALEHRLQVRG